MGRGRGGRSSSSASCSSTWSGSSTSRPSRRSPSGRRGCSSSCSTSSSSSPGSRTSRGAARASTGRRSRSSCGGFVAERALRDRPARHRRGARHQPRPVAALADHRRREPDQHLRRDRGRERLPAERAHGRPEPSRDRARDPPARADCRSTCGSSGDTGCACRSRSCSRSCSWSSSRRCRARGLLGLGAGLLVLAVPYRHKLLSPQLLLPLGAVAAMLAVVLAARWQFFEQVLRSRIDTSANGHVDALRRLRLHPGRALVEPALRARPEQLLRLLRVRHRPDELRPALVLRRHARRDRGRSGRRSSSPSSSTSSSGWGGCVRSAVRSRSPRIRPLAWGMTAALVGTIAVERLLPDDVVLLLLRVRDARAGGADRLRAAPVKVVVLTTSYPRDADDVAGLFVRDAVEARAGAGRGGRGRLAGVLPPLRDRVRARDRRQPAPAAVARAAAAGVPLQLRVGGAAGRPRRRPRPRALAPVRARRARDREAVRRPALGHRRRAGAEGAVALPAARSGARGW